MILSVVLIFVFEETGSIVDIVVTILSTTFMYIWSLRSAPV